MPLSHRDRIQLARQACDFVYRFCTYGSSNRCNSVKHTTAEATKKLRPAQQKFFKQAKAISELPIPEVKQYEKIINKLSEIILRCHAGNCQEMAALAFRFLQYQGVAPIEMVSMPGHTFVVIGRDPASDMTRPTSWGGEAFICDPWLAEVKGGELFKANTVYPAYKLKKILDSAGLAVEPDYSQLVSSYCYAGAAESAVVYKR